jgi:hypothetical protein
MIRAKNWSRVAMGGVLALPLAGCVVDARMSGAEGTFTRTLQVSGPVDLVVRTGSGLIRIHTGPDDTVSVVGHIRAYGGWWSTTDPSEQVKKLEANPPIEQQGDAIRIGEGLDSMVDNVSISYELTVPASTRIRSRSGSGSQVIGRVRGPVEASAGSGRLRIDRVGDHVRASTGSGGIEALGAGAGLDAQAGSGSIYAESIAGAVHARTGSGRVEIEQITSGPIDVKTGSGSVTLRMPVDAAFDLDARTGSGSIESKRPIEMFGGLTRHHLHGRVGGGGSRVAVTTGSGRIRID